MIATNDGSDNHDKRLVVVVRETIQHMIDFGCMRWQRKQVLNSDEAAMDVISRLPLEFRDIDTNKFRHIADYLDKIPADEGGMPSFMSRRTTSREDRIFSALKKWEQRRSHDHSAAYDLDSPDRAEWRRKIKALKGYQCACCGEFRVGELLQVHHYHYRRLGDEELGDVCCVCSPETGSPCHMLLDFAREVKVGKVSQERAKGLFVDL